MPCWTPRTPSPAGRKKTEAGTSFGDMAPLVVGTQQTKGNSLEPNLQNPALWPAVGGKVPFASQQSLLGDPPIFLQHLSRVFTIPSNNGSGQGALTNCRLETAPYPRPAQVDRTEPTLSRWRRLQLRCGTRGSPHNPSQLAATTRRTRGTRGTWLPPEHQEPSQTNAARVKRKAKATASVVGIPAAKKAFGLQCPPSLRMASPMFSARTPTVAKGGGDCGAGPQPQKKVNSSTPADQKHPSFNPHTKRMARTQFRCFDTLGKQWWFD